MSTEPLVDTTLTLTGAGNVFWWLAYGTLLGIVFALTRLVRYWRTHCIELHLMLDKSQQHIHQQRFLISLLLDQGHFHCQKCDRAFVLGQTITVTEGNRIVHALCVPPDPA